MQHLYNFIIQLSHVSGAIEKKCLLREYPDPETLRAYLQVVYDPYKVYHIKKFPKTDVVGTVQGTPSSIFFLLSDLHTRRLTGDEAVRTVAWEWAKGSPEYRALLEWALLKDIRAGVGIKTINSVFPGLIPTFDVMLAQKYDPKRVNWDQGVYASIKWDGIRAIYSKGKFWTRAGKPILGLTHLEKQLVGVPDHWELDGELIVPGQTFQKGAGMIRSNSETPNAVLQLFDLPHLEGTSFVGRKEEIKIWFDGVKIQAPHVKPCSNLRISSPEDMMNLANSTLRRGHEGLIIKSPSHMYQRKRSFDWMKIKGIVSYDLEVVGVYEGTGKNENSLGGLICRFRGDSRVRVGGGYSDQQRVDFWKNPPINQIIHVESQEETDGGHSLRHPQFIEIRTDKTNPDF